MPETISQLRQAEYSITWPEIVKGDLHKLVQEGLLVVAMCQHGVGRSHDAARLLNRSGFLSTCVNRGFEGLALLDEYDQIIGINALQQVSHVMIFLTDEEKRRFFGLLNRIGKVEYYQANGYCDAYESLVARYPRN